MSGVCPPLESFADLIRLQPDDPRRRHVEECPRCRARMMVFRSFLDGKPLPPGVRLEEARVGLGAALQKEIAGGSATTRRPTGGQESQRPGRGFRSSLDGWLRPLWRPATGLAAALLVVLIAVRIAEVRSDRDHRIVLRDAGPVESFAEPLRSLPGGNGSVLLRWSRAADAGGYHVLFFSSALQAIADFDAGKDTTLALPPDRLGRLGAPGSVVFWRVAGLQGEDRIGLSPPAILRLP